MLALSQSVHSHTKLKHSNHLIRFNSYLPPRVILLFPMSLLRPLFNVSDHYNFSTLDLYPPTSSCYSNYTTAHYTSPKNIISTSEILLEYTIDMLYLSELPPAVEIVLILDLRFPQNGILCSLPYFFSHFAYVPSIAELQAQVLN